MTTPPDHAQAKTQARGGVVRKILVAMDGSVHSTSALHYLGGLFAGMTDFFIHLLTVVSSQTGTDTLGAPEDMTSARISVSEQKRYAAALKHLATAAAVLGRCGFAPEAVTTEVLLSCQGIADAIIHQARHGRHDALVIGRRGLGRLEQAVMGSVSASVFEKCHDLPLWIIAGLSHTSSFLVPVDNTAHTLMAVDHLAFIMNGNPAARVTLFHSSSFLQGKDHKTEIDDFCARLGADWCASHLFKPDSLFSAPEQLLVEGGVAMEQIRRVEGAGGVEPGGQILKYAESGGFGTIVMGRRGADVKKGFFGGVSDRVVRNAQEKTVWIVG